MLEQIEATSSKVMYELAAAWRIQALEAGQQEEVRGLERREADMKQRQDEALALHEHFEDMQRVIRDLRSELLTRLPSLVALVDKSEHFAQYGSRQRAEVTTMVDLDGLAVKVMRCPMTDQRDARPRSPSSSSPKSKRDSRRCNRTREVLHRTADLLGRSVHW
ncbi:hypothetical protein ACFXKK_01005 [Streptomyces globisporus]|uniref:hypothetical protein n=1 Tax=Streptomyces globisporus TaxID=1908 RepID=UPI0036540FB0